MAKSKLFTLGGKPFDAKKIQAEIVDAYSETLAQTVGALATDLQNLVDRINHRSTNRGRGFLAVRYNKPIEGAEVRIDEIVPLEKYRIYVPSEEKGSPGYKFNVLDQGIPARKTAEPMLFPIYDGNLTKAGANSATLNRSKVKVSNPTRWYVSNTVGGAPPRNFLEDIIKKRKPVKRRTTSFVRTIRFAIDPSDIKVKVID